MLERYSQGQELPERGGVARELADDPAALRGLAWIGPDDGIAHLPAFRWASRHLRDEDLVARSDDLDAMAALAVAGLGLTLLPRDQVVPGLVPLFPLLPAVHTDLWLLTHPDLRQVPRISALMAFLARALARDPRLAPSTGDPGEATERPTA